jgi:hypothetical protein
MTTTPTISDVPLPAGAVRAFDWAPLEGHEPLRAFFGAERVILDDKGTPVVEVRTSGVQRADGSIDVAELGIELFVRCDVLSPSNALALAPALVEAAVEIGRWMGTITD